jgi:hypothetical protein
MNDPRTTTLAQPLSIQPGLTGWSGADPPAPIIRTCGFLPDRSSSGCPSGWPVPGPDAPAAVREGSAVGVGPVRARRLRTAP